MSRFTALLLSAVISASAVGVASAQTSQYPGSAPSAEAIRNGAGPQQGFVPAGSQYAPSQIYEGRNATVTTPSTQGVEPYIARTIERNARGDS